MAIAKEWFQEWFDTTYYHILYQDRNDNEAEFFMRNLMSYLDLDKNAELLDLPCGKGRHAIYLNTLGYKVTGADLSANSINHAKKYKTKKLKFMVHDMREPLETKFDVILNLFTSFGYFDEDTNIKVLKSLKNGLKNNGVLVIDFMNVHYVKQHLIENEIITKNGIDFKITRSITNKNIRKEIRFNAEGIEHFHIENVRNLSLEKFKTCFTRSNLTLKHVFGDYELNKFQEESSKRLILILE